MLGKVACAVTPWRRSWLELLIGGPAARTAGMSPLASGRGILHLPHATGEGGIAMTGSEPRGIGLSIDLKPHAYDPAANPELFKGVLARRFIAFVIDIVIIMLPVAFAAVFIFFLGLVTFLLGWALFWLLYPGTIVWALVYCGSTLGSPPSATIGMRIMDLEMRTWYGAPAYFVLGAVHAVVFWITITFLTPLVLVVGLLNERHRLLHDILIGTVVINNPVRAQALRMARPSV
jgi:uncharacterized RDD family membrane protein YckC